MIAAGPLPTVNFTGNPLLVVAVNGYGFPSNKMVEVVGAVHDTVWASWAMDGMLQANQRSIAATRPDHNFVDGE
jgi:hypothetical protein